MARHVAGRVRRGGGSVEKKSVPSDRKSQGCTPQESSSRLQAHLHFRPHFHIPGPQPVHTPLPTHAPPYTLSATPMHAHTKATAETHLSATLSSTAVLSASLACGSPSPPSQGSRAILNLYMHPSRYIRSPEKIQAEAVARLHALCAIHSSTCTTTIRIGLTLLETFFSHSLPSPFQLPLHSSL